MLLKALQKWLICDKIVLKKSYGGIIMIDYSRKIKEYRERKFLTQTDLANLLGVSLASITRWETGQYEPTMKIKKKLYVLFLEAGMKVEE